MSIQVNVTTKVNSKVIRRETHNGREHWVVPSYTLPENVVMNGGLYPASEINRHYKKLEGTLAPFGHPQVNGSFVSAMSPEGLNLGHIGAWNRNVKKAGNRVYLEKWIDIEVAKQSEHGRRTIERLEALERGDDVPPIHTSVAVFLDEMPAPNGADYDWVASIIGFDHDAILLDEVGAATPEQGVGMMVNADQARKPKANAGALIGETYRDKEQRLEKAAEARFKTTDDDYVWIADFNDSQVVVIRNGGIRQLFGYTTGSDGILTLDAEGVDVERKESWVKTMTNSIKSFFKAKDEHEGGSDMPLTAEEKAELVKDISANVTEALKPIADKVDTLQANQSRLEESIGASARAAEAGKREAVKAKFGEVVANSLTGEALEQMYQQCQVAAPVLAGNAEQPKAFAPDPKTYLSEVK